MNQRQKNIALIIVLALLVLSSIVLSVTDETTSNTIGNKSLFAVQDTSKIEKISIVSATEKIELKKADGVWMLNDKYKAEQNIVKVLLSILKDAEVTRSVPQSQQKQIAEFIKENGYLVEIYGREKILKTFYSSGNENKTASYMMLVEDDQPYLMSIPGYGSYVAGIFEIPTNDWRDRLILSTNWRTLQQMAINYTDYPEYNVNIRFRMNFLGIDGIDQLDTAKMMNFIQEFNYLQADKYISKGENEKYDSLVKTPETVAMEITDIDPRNSKTIRFFPLLPNDEMMLGYIDDDKQMVLFQTERVQRIFAVKSEFERK